MDKTEQNLKKCKKHLPDNYYINRENWVGFLNVSYFLSVHLIKYMGLIIIIII